MFEHVTPQERAAALLSELPSWLWDGESLPVPVEDIADTHFSLLVRDVSVGAMPAARGAPVLGPGETFSGLLLVEPGEIWVNADEAATWPGRRRFTIGHEIGHYVLHRSRGNVFCRRSVVEEERDPSVPDIEEEASEFSAGLMFPPRLVASHWQRVDGRIDAMCDLFGASRIAMERAVCRAVRMPLVEALRGRVEFFWFDDDAYAAWRSAHVEDGFVMNDDLAGGARLHHARCTYLDRAPQEGRPRTRHPKWCALDAAVLRDALPWVVGCSRCRP